MRCVVISCPLMKRSLAMTLFVLTTGCATGPAGPTLPERLVFKLNEYQEGGGILPLTGRLELTIEPTGDAQSACRRDILTDVVRSGSLNREQCVELVSRVEAWISKGSDLPPVGGQNHGLIIYGAKKAGWVKDAKLPPEVQELVNFLLTIPTTLRLETRMKGH